jgi:hypothetical protein
MSAWEFGLLVAVEQASHDGGRTWTAGDLITSADGTGVPIRWAWVLVTETAQEFVEMTHRYGTVVDQDFAVTRNHIAALNIVGAKGWTPISPPTSFRAREFLLRRPR